MINLKDKEKENKMSTTLKTFKTKKNKKWTNEGAKDLTLTSFWGGTERGRSLQLTLGKEFAQLTRKQTKELAKALLDTL